MKMEELGKKILTENFILFTYKDVNIIINIGHNVENNLYNVSKFVKDHHNKEVINFLFSKYKKKVVSGEENSGLYFSKTDFLTIISWISSELYKTCRDMTFLIEVYLKTKLIEKTNQRLINLITSNSI